MVRRTPVLAVQEHEGVARERAALVIFSWQTTLVARSSPPPAAIDGEKRPSARKNALMRSTARPTFAPAAHHRPVGAGAAFAPNAGSASVREPERGASERLRRVTVPRRGIPAVWPARPDASPAPRSATDQAPIGLIPSRGYPKFHNDCAASEIRIGARELQCIGCSPPHDHPHVYIRIGEQGSALCPYCATRFRHDPKLTPFESDPLECAFAAPEASAETPITRRTTP